MLAVRQLCKSYGAITVLEDISFVLNSNERAGIVGSNGVGKSTLLNILVGQETIDSGSFVFDPHTEVGYLPQTTPEFSGRTMQDLILESVGNLRQLEERMHELETTMSNAKEDQLVRFMDEYEEVSTSFQDRGGYELDYKIESILAGLRLSYLSREREVQTLSGGEKARVGLAILLLRSPDLLLLDEPTNHLDFASLEWLESYFADYKGAILLVSHDRQFLNRSVNQILEIDEYSHHLKKYDGNYDTYVVSKAAERVAWEENFERQQEEIKELRKRMRETARNVAHHRPATDNDKTAYNFFGERVQNTIARGVRAAEEQLRRIEADPLPKPPKLMQVSSNFKVGQLSIGQRRKLEIARLMADSPNVLLLDEPTNYISLDVLEAFEAAILEFSGPVIVVSHDRLFIQRFGGKKWELVQRKFILS